LDQKIAAGKQIVAGDPKGAIGWSMLSGAYLERARVYDSAEDAQQAESAARKSLALRTTGNVGAANRLTQALLEQHRFQEALAAARQARKIKPNDGQGRHLEVDVLLEIGEYAQARSTYASAVPYLQDLSRKLLRARFAEAEGKTTEAQAFLYEATRLAESSSSINPLNLSWYYTKQGDLFAASGQASEAEAKYKHALELHPKSWKALGGMTKLSAMRHDWAAVIDWGHKAEKIAPMPEILALMGDAYAAKGDKAMAEEHYGEVVRLAGYGTQPSHGHAHGKSQGHGHALDRQYAMFCADHDRHLAKALRAARNDLKERHDVLGYDTLAWVLFKKGDQRRAEQAIAKALSQGTKDQRILSHARAIRSKSTL
jgi:tetratricopeptide (TPR) repeat protein